MISLIIYLIYIIYIYIKYKPSCISESYYLIKYPSLFTLWIFLVCITLLPIWLEVTPDNYQFLPFLSTVFLIGVGVFPKYLHIDRKNHIISAIGASILSAVWGLLMQSYLIMYTFIIISLLLIFLKKDQKLFWIENTAFLQIYLQIINRIF